MEATDSRVQEVLARCARRRRVAVAARSFEHWSERSWPGLALLLGVLVAARIARLDPWPVIGGAAAWPVLMAGLTWHRRRGLDMPRWTLPAYVDRRSGALGALMLAFEGQATQRPVPASALQVPFPPLPWRRPAAIWALVTAGYASAIAYPLPVDSATADAVRPAPMPVARSRQLVERVEQLAADEQAFVESAREALESLTSRQGGLDRADFEALERIDGEAERLLKQRGQELLGQREALEELDALLARQPGASGESSAADGTLGEDRGRLAELMQRAGLSREQLEALRQQSGQNRPEGEEGSAEGGSQSGGAFGSREVQALRQQIGEMREVNASRLEQLGDAAGGVDRGPGVAPLELSHATAEQSGTRYDTRSFRARKSDETVMLAAGTSKHGEDAHADPQAQSSRQFEQGTRTELWDKHVKPRHRAVLRSYFGGE